jgi:hypothetical protein
LFALKKLIMGAKGPVGTSGEDGGNEKDDEEVVPEGDVTEEPESATTNSTLAEGLLEMVNLYRPPTEGL